MPQPTVTEGEIPFVVPSAGKPCKTWYKIFGELHGGPGVNHAYLSILSDLTEAHAIPLVLYDQIGSGNSTHLPEKLGDGVFWTEQLFLEELENLLSALGIRDDYDLFGHSWGGMFGSRHAATRPHGLKHLVLASTPASMDLWMEAQNVLRTKLPRKIQDVLDQHEKQGTTDSKEYGEAVGAFYARHLCRLNPVPTAIMEGFECIQKDPTSSVTMTGTSVWKATGTLAKWSMIQEAHKINVPTLVVNGRYDQAQDLVLAPFVRQIPRVKWVKFEESSHMIHFEEREKYMDVLGEFLTKRP
ncbi:proline-specific peptidase [Mycena filopes]|nr:proline-specific peptidase [Mycena filopes]